MIAAEGGYEIDILVTGFPGKSVCHGPLGWSTVALLRGHGRVALVDVGSFGLRPVVLAALAKRDLDPSRVTDVLLTHSHYDHSVNWVSFPEARIVLGASELAWALEQPFGRTIVPELYMESLAASPRLDRVDPGAEVLPGIEAIAAGGHTPGHLAFHLRGAQRDAIFAGDAVKNRAELLGGEADMTLDARASRETIRRIRALWESRPGSILVPGHDLPMVLEHGAPHFLGSHSAAIEVWHGDTLDTTTAIALRVE